MIGFTAPANARLTRDKPRRDRFYTFPRQDAAHPTGAAIEPAALLWLREDALAVGYSTGEIVAWRVVPGDGRV